MFFVLVLLLNDSLIDVLHLALIPPWNSSSTDASGTSGQVRASVSPEMVICSRSVYRIGL